MRNRKYYLLVLLIIAVGLLWLIYGKPFAGPGAENANSPALLKDANTRIAEPAASPTVHEITTTLGDTLYGYGYIVTVGDTDHSDIFNDQFVASEDHTLRAYYVTMESDSPTGLEVNPHFWRLFDYQTPSFPEVYAGKDPALVTDKALTRGEKLQGWVTFEIPKGTNHFKLAYDIPNIGDKVSFVFDVG